MNKPPLYAQLADEYISGNTDAAALAKKLERSKQRIHQLTYEARRHGLIPAAGATQKKSAATTTPKTSSKTKKQAAPDLEITAQTSGTAASTYAQHASEVVELIAKIEQLDDVFLLHVKLLVAKIANQRLPGLSDQISIDAKTTGEYTPLKSRQQHKVDPTTLAVV